MTAAATAGEVAASGGGRGEGLGRGTSANLVGTAASAIANLAFTVVVTRGVGRHEAGELFTATSLFLLLQMTSKLGADTGATYFVSRSVSLDGGSRTRGYLRALIRPVVVATVLACAVLVVLAELWDDSSGNADTAVFVLALVAFLPAATASDIALAATRGFGDMRPTVLLDKVVRPAGQLLLVAIAVEVGAGLWLPVAWGLPYVVTAVLAGRAIGVAVSAHRPARRAAPPTTRDAGSGLTREFWRFSGPRALASVAQTVMQRLDIVLVALMRGPRDAAVYTAATRFLTVAQMVNLAISQPLQPRLSGLLARGDLAGAKDVYQRTTGWLVLLAWPILLWCAVSGSLYLRVFGRGYSTSAAVAVVVILALTMSAAFLCGTVDMLLIMAGRTTWNLANTVAALVVLVVLDVLLIPGLGIVGAAVGWAAAIAVNNLAPLYQVHRSLGLHPFGRGTLAAAAVGGLSFGVLPEVVLRLGHDSWSALGVGTLLGAALFLAGLWWARDALALRELMVALPRGRGRARRAG